MKPLDGNTFSFIQILELACDQLIKPERYPSEPTPQTMDAGPNVTVFGHMDLEEIEANVQTLRRRIRTRFFDLGCLRS